MATNDGLIYDTTKITSLTITSAFSSNTLKSTDYSDSVITIDASARTKGLYINGNANNNVIIGGSSNDTLAGGTGNDNLTGGNGNDVFIYTAGNDAITDFSSGDSIQVSESISAYSQGGNDVSFKVGAGTIKITGGKDTEIPIIRYANNKTSALGYYYNGLLYNAAVAKATALSITSAYGNVLDSVDYASTAMTIDASGRTVAINIAGNAKANSIKGTTGNDTIGGGSGNDTLIGGNGNDVFVYSAGNDVITDYTAGQDTLKISSTVTSYIANGNDLILKIGSGSVKISGGKTEAISIVDTVSSYTYQNNLLYNGLVAKATAVTVMTNHDNTLAAADLGTAVITVDASAHSKAMRLEGNDKNNVITGTSGDDTIYGNAGTDSLFGGAGNDSLFGGAGNDSLFGGAGNDTLTGGEGNDIFIFQGGNDVITDFAETQDTLRFANDNLGAYSISGNDLIFTVASGTVRVIDGKSKAVTAIDSDNNSLTYQSNLIYNNLVAKATAVTVTTDYGDTLTAADYGAGVLTVDASAHENAMNIAGNAKNNSVIGTSGDDTLTGGAGNDTVTGGDGADLFIFEAGNDVITDYTAGEDTLKIASGAISSITFAGEDITFKIGSGSVKVNGVKSKTLTFIDADKNERVCEGGVIYNDARTSEASAVTVTAGFDATFNNYSSSVYTIDASARTTAINIVGNAKANQITGTTGNDTINGGAGSDYIFGGNGNDTLNGERGNDTLFGGAGNDTMTGGAGRDVFVYEVGNDVITDYSANEDFISIVSGSVTGYSLSGRDAVLKIGNGLVTVQNAAESTIRILNAGGIPSTELKISTDTSDTDSTVQSALIFDESSTAVTITTMNGENFAASNYTDLVSIDASQRGAIRITGNSNSNVIIGSVGNDTLTGGAGKDTFVYYGDNDLDIIRDYTQGEDYISLAGGVSLVGGMAVGNNVLLLTETGTIKLTSAKNKSVIVLDGDNQREYINGVYIPENLYIDNTNDNTLVAGGDGNDTIASSGTNDTLVGGAGKDLFISKGGSALIEDYTYGDDTINVAAVITDAAAVGNNIVISTTEGVFTIAGAKNKPVNLNGVNTIIGSNSDDTGSGIYNDNTRNNTFVGGTSYDDTLANSAENVTMSGGAGRDLFIHRGGSAIITDYASGEDTIQIDNATISSAVNSGDNVVIYTSNGALTLLDAKGEAINVDGSIITIIDDPASIINKTDSTLVSGDAEIDNRITNSGVNVTIEAALGNDSVVNSGDNTKINGDGGNDTISNSAYGVSIDGNRGDDAIINSGNNTTIYGNYGDDTITNTGNSTYLTGEYVQIFGGYGNDFIRNNLGSNVTIEASYGADTIFSSGNNVQITGGEDADTFIYGGGTALITDYTAGTDSIEIASGSIISATQAEDTNDVILSLSNGSLTISGAAGDTLNIGGYDTIIGEKIPENIGVSINNTVDNTLIAGTAYNDTLANSGENVIIYGGDGNDIFIGEGGSALITDYTPGEDSIQLVGITDTSIAGNNVILSAADASFTVLGGKDKNINVNGADTLFAEVGISVNNTNDDTLIAGTRYDDTLANSGENVTLTGSTGKDIFIHEGGSAIITDYTSGEDSIQIADITDASVSGSNVILSADEGTMTVIGGKDKTLNINGANTVISDAATETVETAVSIDNTVDDTLISGTDYDDTLANSGENVTLTGGEGSDIFIYRGGNAIITDYTSGEDSLQFETEIASAELDGDDVVISTDDGFFTILNGKDTTINLNGSDTVISEEEPETNTTLVVMNSTSSPVTAGTAIEVIDATGRTTSVRITANAKANTIYGGSGADTIYGGNGADVIYGNAGNDKLYGEVGNDTLNGGAGTNTLTGGTGNDVFVYDGGSVYIADYTPGQDVIKINTGRITAASVSSSDVVLTANSHKITVKGGKGKTLSINDASGSEYTTVIGGDSSSTTVATAVTISNSDASPVTVGSSVLSIDASKRSTALQITANAKGNTIYGGSSYDTIYGGAGNDSIFGNKSNDHLYGENGNDSISGGDGNDIIYGGSGTDNLSGDAGNDTVYGGDGNDVINGGAGVDRLFGEDGNDTINGGDGNDSILGGAGADHLYGDAGNDTIDGGAGNDYLEGGAGADKLLGDAGNDTLEGGAGNDTLTGGAGNDVFVYGSGGGKDVITDYSAGQDKIKITSGTISKTAYSGNNVIFTIGTGTLTVNDAKGKRITITDASGSTTTQTYGAVSGSSALWFTADDNNFIGNDTNLDSISKVAADYSSGDYSATEIKNLAQDKTYISYSKK